MKLSAWRKFTVMINPKLCQKPTILGVRKFNFIRTNNLFGCRSFTSHLNSIPLGNQLPIIARKERGNFIDFGCNSFGVYAKILIKLASTMDK